ncbi:hypothetical protein NEOLEDRAFT_1179868 [Neolentinus lepideus HHB14362 ss-1]|uniref:Protein UNC80 C-terminal domain-containing protein n=1 Tax=Neolentinus lepideus HHB14362 ss-1 TaxID=1314782 RepID=A0A165RCV2_9AGAM|nr:hypothetical protein NEOLEDRAFT_1179868 [Neolentinus lepideus HHB14362 ss-1]
MTSRGDPHKKKPSGSRPLHRKLFSLDSQKRQGSESSYASDDASTSEGPGHIRGVSNAPVLNAIDSEEDPFSDGSTPASSQKALADSPISSFREDVDRSLKSSESVPDLRTKSVPKFRVHKLGNISVGSQQSLSEGQEPPPSPSRRWDHIRQQLVPSASIRHQQSSSSLGQSSAYGSSKPSRFVRLGWGHTVDRVRQVAADDTRRFEEELRRACGAARSVEYAKLYRADRDAPPANAPPLHKPFMSTASLPFSGNSSASSLPLGGGGRYGLRRPQSVMSFASLASGSSLNELRSLLVRYASPEMGTQALPLENEVLSALLIPFLNPDTSPRTAEQERMNTLDAFEILIGTWQPLSTKFALERCLWCAKAASAPPTRLRVRILSVLDRLLSEYSSLFPGSPINLQTLLHALLSLLSLYGSDSSAVPELKFLKGILSKIRDGNHCVLSMQAIEEEYDALSVKEENESNAREAIFSGAFMRCFENGARDSRRWLLWNALEEYWRLPPVSPRLTPLLAKIHTRNVSLFMHSAIALLVSPSTSADIDSTRVDAEVISRFLRTQIIPLVEVMQDQDAQAARPVVARLVIHLLALDSARKQARDDICEWYQPGGPWKIAVETAIKDLLSERNWSSIARTVDTFIKVLPDDTRKALLTFCLPFLYDTLAAETVLVTDRDLILLLNNISRTYPQIFFKPVILCAASSKETTVIKQLRVCIMLSSFVTDFYTRDPDMMSVALLSDVAGGKSTAGSANANPRLGQLVILTELILSIRRVSQIRDHLSSIDPSLSTLPKFIMGLDAQLGVLLEAKEHKCKLSTFHRMLLCILFLEMRLYVRSLKYASWLPRVIAWATEMYGSDDRAEFEQELENVADTVKRVQALYMGITNESTLAQKRRSALVLSTNLEATGVISSGGGGSAQPALSKSRGDLDAILSNNLPSAVLQLLVAVSGLLRGDDFARLGRIIWRRCLDENDCKVIAPACFLAMQCAEKTENLFLPLVQDDLRSADTRTKCRTVQKLGILASWRFQILAQDHIVDMNHRRAFKLARPPLLFVATDMGTSLFVHNDDSTEYVDSQGNVLPAELRKRLAEIGWSQDEKLTDEKVLWKKTPMSVLPNTFMDQSTSFSESLISAPSSPHLTPETSPRTVSPSVSDDRNVRRPSNVRNIKRRPVFVHALVSVFPEVALLTSDSDIAVSSAARNFIIDMMRDDPALLCRPIFDALARDEHDLARAVRTLRTFAHVKNDLPPSLTHHVFNHLAGFLKHCARREEEGKPLMGFAYVLPVMSSLASRVSEISIREIRRAKMEVFLIPSGSLWFPSASQDGPMFPRQIDNPLESLSSHLVWITMVRISQNLLFLDMLKQNPQDVQIIRKRLSRLVLPSRDGSTEAPRLDLVDFVPHQSDSCSRFRLSLDNRNLALIGLSLLLSRSYLLLIRQIFLSMSRHLNDRNELSVYLDGLNRILLAHGDDVGIVSQAMIALLTATTRFQRMFQSGSGYTLFMPAVVKVYTESEHHPAIRASIEYAVNRFFALHGYAFIFQSMSVLAHIITIPDIDAPWMAKGVYSLFSSLRNGVQSSDAESTGLPRVSKKQEREALIINVAEEKPQTFLASLRRGTGPTGETIAFDLPEEYEGKRFELRDFALFFINFIAEQDATLLRAELFLQFLRLLTPHLYHGSRSTHVPLRDGIEHIGTILLTRTPSKVKVPEPTLLNPTLHHSVEVYSVESHFENQLTSKSTSPSNLYVMRLEYLSLVVALTQAGGKISSAASARVTELLAAIVKDSARPDNVRISKFLEDYSKSLLVREEPLTTKEVTSFFAGLLPFVHDNAHIIDCSALLEAICGVAVEMVHLQDPAFLRVVKEYCSAGLRLCEDAANKDSIFEVSARPKLVKLLSNAVSFAMFDAVTEIIQCRATPGFLAGIILPLTLSLGTRAGITAPSQVVEGRRHQSQTTAWIRLLSYILSICDDTHRPAGIRRSPSVNVLERSKSQDGRESKIDASRAAVLAMAIQTLKVIISRAENELSSSMPGIWHRVATAIRTLLSEGDAKFAVTAANQGLAASPAQSPSSSSFLPSPSSEHFGSSYGLQRQTSGSSRRIRRPRLVDYLLWSFLWWLQLQRGPLLLQLRTFVHEKMHAVDQSLRAEEDASAASWAGTNEHRRSSVFVKPRRHVTSSIYSASSSPDTSPKLGAMSFPSQDSLATPTQAGFPRKPGFSLAVREKSRSSSLKIVHLGPVRRSIAVNLEHSFNQDPVAAKLNASRYLSNAGLMRLSSLVKETYYRIRAVQQYMGYDLLVPLPNTWSEDETVRSRMSHTKSYILDSLIEESKDLLEDLCMQEREGEDDMVMVNMDDTSG